MLRSTSLRSRGSWSTDLNSSAEEASQVQRQTFTITASSGIGTHHSETTLHGTRAEDDCPRDETVSLRRPGAVGTRVETLSR